MITSTPPVVNPNAKYRLSEVAAILGVSRMTVHKWAEKGFLRFGVSRSNGRRFWTGREILRAWKNVL